MLLSYYVKINLHKYVLDLLSIMKYNSKIYTLNTTKLVLFTRIGLTWGIHVTPSAPLGPGVNKGGS